MSVRRRQVKTGVKKAKTMSRQIGEFRKGLREAQNAVEELALARMRDNLARLERENDELRAKNR